MNINDMVKMMRGRDTYLASKNKEPQLPNGSLPPKDHVNPYCTPGMDITGMKFSDFKTMPIEKDVEEKFRNLVLEEFKKGYGMSDPDADPISDFIKSYYMSDKIAIDDRKHYAHTLEQISIQEARRISDFIESRVPGWEPGKKFDLSILDDYHIGISVTA